MTLLRLAVTALFLVSVDGPVLDSMDSATWTMPTGKGAVEVVEGRDGKALRFTFPENCSGLLAKGRVRGSADWDGADGFSFWVKGDGSRHLGGIEVIWNGDYSERYACSFPIDGTDWRKVTVAWHDLIPEVGKMERGIDASGGNAPSKVSWVAFGKWWYWRDYAAHSYAIDDMRLEPRIPTAPAAIPSGGPLDRIRAKLKAGKPITIVTMGDSLTDTAHWSNRQTNWPAMLKERLKAKTGSDVTIVNPAMGGTELRQNLVVMPRWVAEAPAPDLVTVFFGGNDWNAGMRGANFLATQKDAIDRIRRATGGRADILILTTCPSLENGAAYQELADACRKAAADRNAGIADVFARVQALDPDLRQAFFADDKVHLAPAGQSQVADAVMQALVP